MPAGEATGKPNPLRRPLYTTGFKDSPVKERLPNMPVKCNLVGATTQVEVTERRRYHSPNAKGNFQFERVVTGWRGTSVLDFRLKR
jgi:hypothetical protein